MTCNNCGSESSSGAAFCSKCGAKFEDITQNMSSNHDNQSTQGGTGYHNSSSNENSQSFQGSVGYQNPTPGMNYQNDIPNQGYINNTAYNPNYANNFENAPKKSKTKLIAIVSIAILAVAIAVAGILIVPGLLSSGGNAQDRSISFFETVFTFDSEAIDEYFLEEELVYYEMNGIGDLIIDSLGSEFEIFMDDPTVIEVIQEMITFEFVEERIFEGDELEFYQSLYSEMGVEVDEVSEVTVSMHMEMYDESEEMYLVMVKVGNTWYVGTDYFY